MINIELNECTKCLPTCSRYAHLTSIDVIHGLNVINLLMPTKLKMTFIRSSTASVLFSNKANQMQTYLLCTTASVMFADKFIYINNLLLLLCICSAKAEHKNPKARFQV